MDERIEKLRQERIDNKPSYGVEKILEWAAKGVLMEGGEPAQ